MVKYVAFVLVVMIGIIAVLSQPTHEDGNWLATLLIAKAVGVGMLLFAGWLGERWFGWQIKFND